MSTYDYQVGQILWLVQHEKQRILPCQVVEEVVKKSISGSSITYNVNINVDGKMLIVELSTLKCDVYTSADKLKKALIQRATTSITKMVGDIVNQTSTIFTKEPRFVELNTGNRSAIDVLQDPQTLNRADEQTSKGIRVTMPDGEVVNLVE